MASRMQVQGMSRFTGMLKEAPEVIGRTADSIVRQEARALCVAFGAGTMPGGFSGGLTGKAVEEFDASIRAQIARVYATKDEGLRLLPLIQRRSPRLASAYRRAVKEGNVSQQKRYLREAGIQPDSLDPSLHREARTGRGASVAKGQKAQALVPANQRKRYAREKGALAGLAKAAWYAAAKSIGGRVRRNIVEASGKRRTEEIFPARLRSLARRFPQTGGSRVTFQRVEIFSNITYAVEALPDALYDRAVMSAQASFAKALRDNITALRRRRFKFAA
jgi:hypothetical protein